MTTYDDVRAALDRLEAERSTAASERDRAVEKVAAAVTQHEVDSATIVKLTADLAACEDDTTQPPPPPPPPTGAVMVGSNTEGTGYTWEQLIAKTGPLDIRRVFETGVPTSFAKKCQQDIDRKNAVVWSIKTGATFTSSTILNLLKGIPSSMKVFFAVHHEPEDNLTPAQFKTLQANLRPVVDSANVGRSVPILFGGIFMSSAAPGNGTKYNMADFYPGNGVWDYLGWDCYNKATGSNARKASTIFANCMKLNTQYKLPFMVAELGTVENRAAWITEATAYCKTNKALTMIYYNTNYDGYPYALVTDADFKALGAGAIA